LVDYGVYIVVSGRDWGVVDSTVERVQRKLQEQRIETRVPWFRMNRAARTVTGLSQDMLGDTYIVSGRSVAAGFPWAATDTVEEGGVVFGEDEGSGRPAVLDRFSWASPHVAVLGQTGSGKTFFTKLQLLRCSRVYEDLQVLILDLKPGLEYGDIEQGLDCSVRRWEIGDRTADNPDLLEESLREAYDAVINHTGLSVLVVDEAHRLLNDGKGRQVLGELIREGRDQDIACTVVTQNAADFTRTYEGRNILRQVDCYILMRHQDVDTSVEEFFNLSGRERVRLRKLRTGTDVGFSEAVIRGPVNTTLRIEAMKWEMRGINDG